MLTQQEADALILMLKRIKDTEALFDFPTPGEYKVKELTSDDGKHAFIVDINRKGSLNLVRKCTYQGRYQRDNILLRLDVNGPEHTNPDGVIISGNHIHIYKEDYGDSIAFELPKEIINNGDLIQTLVDFLIFFKVNNTTDINVQGVI